MSRAHETARPGTAAAARPATRAERYFGRRESLRAFEAARAYAAKYGRRRKDHTERQGET